MLERITQPGEDHQQQQLPYLVGNVVEPDSTRSSWGPASMRDAARVGGWR